MHQGALLPHSLPNDNDDDDEYNHGYDDMHVIGNANPNHHDNGS